jgi:hypothetical protein
LADAAETPIELRLRKAIDIVSEDATLVELWACALSGFAQPIPDYAGSPPSRLPRAPNIIATASKSEPEVGVPKRR